MDIKIEGFSIEESHYYQASLDLRASVFIEEMGFDKRIEFDGNDGKAMHYILLYDLLPAGCARWIEDKGTIIIDRFCINKKYRKYGLAIVLIKFILSELQPSKKEINLLTTDNSVVFFTQVGFRDSGSTADFGKKQVRILSYSNG